MDKKRTKITINNNQKLSFLLIILTNLLNFSNSSKLLMTVEGGPYDSLARGYGKFAVLYGDQWDRGYKYNASTNKDLNKFEGAHSELFIEGIAEHKQKKMVITAGTDGAIAFWSLKKNKTIYRFPDLAGKNISLTDLVITPNDLIIVTAAKKTENVLFLPISQLGIRDFIPVDGGHDANVTRVRNVYGVPMFVTLSGGLKDTSRVIRWSASDPPLKLGHYESRGVLDMIVDWKMRRLYLGKIDKSIEVLDMKSGSKKMEKKKAHKGPVTGLAFIPKVHYIVSGGGFKVKIWDKDLKVVEVLNDSKASISGRVIYKMEDKMIGAVNLKGIVFWNQCKLKYCLICAKKGQICNTCVDGYEVNHESKECVKSGSAMDPIPWKFKHLNIDRTKFRISFPKLHQNKFHLLHKTLDPTKYVKLHVGRDTSTNEHFDLKFLKNPYNKVWDFECKFKKGIGLRNLNAIILNKTSRRRVLLNAKTHYAPVFYFEPGPKKVAIPSMPAFKFSLIPIYYIIGTIYRFIYWFCIVLMVIDMTRRLIVKKSWEFIRLLRYCITYSTVTLISLLKINMRPVVTESNIGLHRAVHIDYYIFAEIHLDKNSLDRKYFFEKNKITEYLTIHVFFSALLQILNSFQTDNSTFYLELSFWFAVSTFVLIFIEILRVNLVGVCGKREEVHTIFKAKSDYDLKSMIEDQMDEHDKKKIKKNKLKKKMQKKVKSALKNPKDSAPPSLADFDSEKNIPKSKKPKKKVKKNAKKLTKKEKKAKVPFFLNTSMIWEKMKNSMSLMSKIKTSQIPDELSKYFLDFNNICQEFVGSYMGPNFHTSILAKLFHVTLLFRGLIIGCLICFVDDYRRIQAWSIFGLNTFIFLLTLPVGVHFEFRGLYIFQEFLYFLWGGLLVVNAHDDINPVWGLPVFWGISVTVLLCRFFIMLIDIYLILWSIVDAVEKKPLIEKEGGSEEYIQQGFDVDNKPVDTERVGINYDAIIHNEIKSNRSNVWGNSLIQGVSMETGSRGSQRKNKVPGKKKR